MGLIFLYEVVVFGNKDIVEYFLKNVKVDVNVLDFKFVLLFMYVSGLGYSVICLIYCSMEFKLIFFW